jgi:hypothetical protein
MSGGQVYTGAVERGASLQPQLLFVQLQDLQAIVIRV